MITLKDGYDEDFVNYVIKQTFTYLGTDVSSAISKSKDRKVSDARHIVWYILHYNYDYSSFLIATIFKINRRSVMSGIANTKFFIENMEDDSFKYDEILKTIEW